MTPISKHRKHFLPLLRYNRHIKIADILGVQSFHNLYVYQSIGNILLVIWNFKFIAPTPIEWQCSSECKQSLSLLYRFSSNTICFRYFSVCEKIVKWCLPEESKAWFSSFKKVLMTFQVHKQSGALRSHCLWASWLMSE